MQRIMRGQVQPAAPRSDSEQVSSLKEEVRKLKDEFDAKVEEEVQRRLAEHLGLNGTGLEANISAIVAVGDQEMQDASQSNMTSEDRPRMMLSWRLGGMAAMVKNPTQQRSLSRSAPNPPFTPTPPPRPPHLKNTQTRTHALLSPAGRPTAQIARAHLGPLPLAARACRPGGPAPLELAPKMAREPPFTPPGSRRRPTPRSRRPT